MVVVLISSVFRDKSHEEGSVLELVDFDLPTIGTAELVSLRSCLMCWMRRTYLLVGLTTVIFGVVMRNVSHCSTDLTPSSPVGCSPGTAHSPRIARSPVPRVFLPIEENKSQTLKILAVKRDGHMNRYVGKGQFVAFHCLSGKDTVRAPPR